MRIFLQTPALRYVTDKFSEAISSLDSKISNSPTLSSVLGAEKPRGLFLGFHPINPRDIQPFLNERVVKKTVEVSMRREAQRRLHSSLAVAAYLEDPQDLTQELLSGVMPSSKTKEPNSTVKTLKDFNKCFEMKKV